MDTNSANRPSRLPASVQVAMGLAVVAGMATGYRGASDNPTRVAAGETLFLHEWLPRDPLAGGGDGLGPVFNARSCVACHFQAGVGGAGPNDRNVTSFVVFPTPFDEQIQSGVVHALAVRDDFLETTQEVRGRYPIVPGRVVSRGGCAYQEPDFDPLHFATVNTPPLFGTGRIDEISDSAIRRNVHWKRLGSLSDEVLGGDFTGTPSGRVRVLADGRVGKFGWKAQFATLEEFVAEACAVEVGLTNPYRAQDLPRSFGPDAEAALDMTRRQFRDLVAFCRSLEEPRRVIPSSSSARRTVSRGERLFHGIGCADCHTPNLGGVEGLYSDLALHRVERPGTDGYDAERQIPLPRDLPGLDEWKTPPLWGVADSAPYWHDGSAPTLESAIMRHHGEARRVTERFLKELTTKDRRALISFLESLRAPASFDDALSGSVLTVAR